MLQRMQKIIIILLSLIILINPAIAQETPKSKVTCKEVLDACDKALVEKNKALQLSNLALSDSQKNSGELQTKLNARDEALASWYHNPVILMGLGFIAGGLTYAIVRK